MLRKIFGAAVAALFMTMLAGCASFPQDKLATVSALPDVSGYTNKPNVYVDLRLYRGAPGSADIVDMTAAANAELKPLVDSVLKDSKLFANYSFDKFKQGEADATIQLHFYNHGSTGGAMVSGFITGFTFGVIPGAATDHYSLQAKVVERDGRETGSYRNDDAIRTWIGIWFIPVAGNTPKEALVEVVTNMTRDALKVMVEQKHLKFSAIERRFDAAIAP